MQSACKSSQNKPNPAMSAIEPTPSGIRRWTWRTAHAHCQPRHPGRDHPATWAWISRQGRRARLRPRATRNTHLRGSQPGGTERRAVESDTSPDHHAREQRAVHKERQDAVGRCAHHPATIALRGRSGGWRCSSTVYRSLSSRARSRGSSEPCGPARARQTWDRPTARRASPAPARRAPEDAAAVAASPDGGTPRPASLSHLGVQNSMESGKAIRVSPPRSWRPGNKYSTPNHAASMHRDLEADPVGRPVEGSSADTSSQVEARRRSANKQNTTTPNSPPTRPRVLALGYPRFGPPLRVTQRPRTIGSGRRTRPKTTHDAQPPNPTGAAPSWSPRTSSARPPSPQRRRREARRRARCTAHHAIGIGTSSPQPTTLGARARPLRPCQKTHKTHPPGGVPEASRSSSRAAALDRVRMHLQDVPPAHWPPREGVERAPHAPDGPSQTEARTSA